MVDSVTIIVAIVTVISAITPIIVFFYQRNRKVLAYEIISANPLLTRNELEGRIKIILDDRIEVPNIFILVFKLINSGNIPIISSDYESPIKVSFDNQQEILSC
jgi:hypothetical protein